MRRKRMDEETEGEKQRTQDCKKCHIWTFSHKPLYSNNKKRLAKETEGEKQRTEKKTVKSVTSVHLMIYP